MFLELNVIGAETSDYFDEERTLFEGNEQECLDFAANWIADNEDYFRWIDGYLTIDGNQIEYKWNDDYSYVVTYYFGYYPY